MLGWAYRECKLLNGSSSIQANWLAAWDDSPVDYGECKTPIGLTVNGAPSDLYDQSSSSSVPVRFDPTDKWVS